MIVVDSSVWIAHFRDVRLPPVMRLRAIHDESAIVVGDLVLLELLQGARDDAHAARIEAALRCYTVMPMLDADRASRAASCYRLLRARGVTIRGTADLIIGTFCLDHDFSLLHHDRDFDHMAAHLGLAVA